MLHFVDGISPAARNKAIASGAGQWLKELPDLLSGLEQDWLIKVGDPFSDATEAFVAQARGESEHDPESESDLDDQP